LRIEADLGPAAKFAGRGAILQGAR
jgi:hypothetical protein